MIRHISAVTFAVRDMARSIEFYGKLGFELRYGGDRAGFRSMKAGEAFVNLVASPGYERRWWGRAISESMTWTWTHITGDCRLKD
jgi:catechol 2,3-dioxygenase-like lactoylglutathione lyase family enzyme